MIEQAVEAALGLPFDLAVGAGITAGVSLVVMAVLRREAGLPLSVSVLFVPFVVGLGFGLAVGVHLYLAVSMLHSAAVLAAGLVGLVVVYEWLHLPDAPRV